MTPRLLPALLCAVLLSASASSAPQTEDAAAAPADSGIDWGARVASALERVGAPGSRAASETARGLAGFGEPIVPALLVGLTDRRVLGNDGQGVRVDEAREAVLADALDRLGRAAVLAAARSALAAHGEFPSGSLLPPYLEGLARVGTANDLELALELALACKGDDLAALAAQRGLERAFREVAARDAVALRELPRLMRAAPLDLDLALVRGAAACEQPQALAALLSMLDEDRDASLAILSEVPRAARAALRPLDPMLAHGVRERLADLSTPPSVQRAALRASVALGDDAALPAIVELLRSEDASMRSEAAAALRGMTGLLYDSDVERWSAWLDIERSWNAKVLPELRDDLASVHRGTVIESLRTLSQHRYRRDELAQAAGALLAHHDPHVRMEAIDTLAKLGSPAGLPLLREQLPLRQERELLALRRCIARLGGGEELAAETAFP